MRQRGLHWARIDPYRSLVNDPHAAGSTPSWCNKPAV
jgi:hypothetical protein